VDVDAIPPKELIALARQCIEQHIDEGALIAMQTIEEEERSLLDQILRNWEPG
jgi:hypothetical protein